MKTTNPVRNVIPHSNELQPLVSGARARLAELTL
jgi:hypothetical protein